MLLYRMAVDPRFETREMKKEAMLTKVPTGVRVDSSKKRA